MHLPNSKILAWVTVCLAAWAQMGLGQAPPPVILQIDLDNVVFYWDDLSDRTKLATDAGVTTWTPNTFGQATFQQNVWLADIVAVNGKPVKGTFVSRSQNLNLSPNPAAGQAIGDITRTGGPGVQVFEILQTDGTPVGTIWAEALVGGSAPPGSPAAIRSMNGAVIGGTGAFLGIRGQCGLMFSTLIRGASQSEDPGHRRLNGAGRMQLVLYLIPLFRPEIITTAAGPAVFHADFSPVSTASQTQAGEVLTLRATGLGPTVPGVDPGQPFPTGAMQQVNSPITVSVNGQAANVINSVGWPGDENTYRVDFRVPDGAISGANAIQLSVAWISSPIVYVPVQ
jgi:hypothetical protein